jgi:hypothetical protein
MLSKRNSSTFILLKRFIFETAIFGGNRINEGPRSKTHQNSGSGVIFFRWLIAIFILQSSTTDLESSAKPIILEVTPRRNQTSSFGIVSSVLYLDEFSVNVNRMPRNEIISKDLIGS